MKLAEIAPDTFVNPLVIVSVSSPDPAYVTPYSPAKSTVRALVDGKVWYWNSPLTPSEVNERLNEAREASESVPTVVTKLPFTPSSVPTVPTLI